MKTSLKDIQKEKLRQVIIGEGRKVGRTYTPTEVDAQVEAYYDVFKRTPGAPLTAPTLQEARSKFDTRNYNDFVEGARFDMDTVLSQTKRSRMASRNLLLGNDIRIKSYSDRLADVDRQVDDFHNEKPEETTGAKTKTFQLPIEKVEYSYPDTTRRLEVDGKYKTVSQEKNTETSTSLNLGKLVDESGVNFQPVVSAEQIKNIQEEAPFFNTFRTDANPWVYRLTLGTQEPVTSAKLVINVALNSIEKFNNVEISPVGGIDQDIEVSTVDNTGLENAVGSKEFKSAVSMNVSPIRVIQTLRLVLTSRTVQQQDGLYEVVFGLTSLKINLNSYKKEGEVLLRNIDPGVGSAPILSVNLQAEGDFPESSSAQYSIDVNGSDLIDPESPINGHPADDSSVNFSIASTLENDNSLLTRTPFKTINAVEFHELGFSGIGSLDLNQGRTFVPEVTDLWVGQNTWRVSEPVELKVQAIRDAIVTFGDDLQKTQVRVPMQPTDMGLFKDATGHYLELPLDVASTTIDPDADTSAEPALNRMTNGTYGVYEVKRYDSDNPNNSTPIASEISLVDGNKIYVNGTYGVNDSFSVSYLGLLDESVLVTNGTLKLHSGTGDDGQYPENTIKTSSGKYQFDFRSNEIFSTHGSDLSNNTYYLDFEGRFESRQMLVYEAYAFSEDTREVVELDQTLEVDRYAGEYISMTHLSSGVQTTVDSTATLTDLKKGWYLITVQSKPFSSHPSAIKKMMEVKDFIGDGNPELVFSTSSKFFSKFGVSNEPLEYVKSSKYLNRSPRVDAGSFTAVKIAGQLKYIVTAFGHDTLEVAGGEKASIQITYYPEDLFNVEEGSADHRFSRLKLKIALSSNTAGNSSTFTASINKIRLKITYL